MLKRPREYALEMVEAGSGTDLGVYLAEIYALEKGISASTEYVMGVSVRAFSGWLGRPVTVGDLQDFTVSRWLRDLEESGKWAKRTISGRRGDILAMWRHAAEGGLVDGPVRVRGVKVPRPMPVAWSLNEFRRLLESAGGLRGYLKNGLPRGQYFWAVFSAAYETGLRRSDLLRLRLADVGADGVVVVVQTKTGRAHAAGVRPATRDAMVELSRRLERDGEPHAEQPLRWPYTMRAFYHWVGRVTRTAGVKPGALQQCRRTGATHSERAQHGAGMRYLGHASASQAQAHYIDAGQAYGAILPPAADEGA